LHRRHLVALGQPKCVNPVRNKTSKRRTPPRSRNAFKKSDTIRRVDATKDAGHTVARVEIDPRSGRISIVTKEGDDDATPAGSEPSTFSLEGCC
jgi:hypothetical protein